MKVQMEFVLGLDGKTTQQRTARVVAKSIPEGIKKAFDEIDLPSLDVEDEDLESKINRLEIKAVRVW